MVTSNRRARGILYEAIGRCARPGDVLFFITESESPGRAGWLSRRYRGWIGLDDSDHTVWHTALYAGVVKERGGSYLRPEMIHARQGGVIEEHIPPSYYTNSLGERGVPERTRLEVVSCPSIGPEQRESIVEYCRAQVGKPFDDRGWRQDLWTYAFGLRGAGRDPGSVSCHGLVYEAYDRVGVHFPHQLRATPAFNLGKHIGHPLGHPRDRVDLSFPYLRDHHLYRDDRFVCVLAIYQDRSSHEMIVVEDPPKYSWDHYLSAAYLAS
jgi:hypothetical protein